MSFFKNSIPVKVTPDIIFSLIERQINAEMNCLEVKGLCELTEVSRSGHYNWLRRKAIRKQREIKDRMDFELILEAYRFRGYAKGAIKACFCII